MSHHNKCMNMLYLQVNIYQVIMSKYCLLEILFSEQKEKNTFSINKKIQKNLLKKFYLKNR